MADCLVLLIGRLENDSRVLKECRSLAGLGYRVHVFALGGPGLAASERLDFGEVSRFTPRERAGGTLAKLGKLADVFGGMYRAGKALRPGIIHANDLSALPLGVLLARATGAKLVYDSHELWRDTGFTGGMPAWVYNVGIGAERWLAPRADGVITVSESIVRDMAEHLKIAPPTLVRNAPPRRAPHAASGHPLREALGLGLDVPLVLYQGGMGPGYGTEVLLEAFREVAPPAVLVYMGHGPLHDTLVERARAYGLADRVLFKPPVPPAVVLDYTADATIGVVASQAISTSYRYSLPNKFFEFLQAGLPVVVSDLPELGAMTRKHGVGETFAEGDPHALAAALNGLLGDPARLDGYRRAVAVAAAELHWENEALALAGLYQRLCPPTAASSTSA